MSASVLLNLLNKFGGRDKIRSLLSINHGFFTTSLINSIIQEQFENDSFYLSYDSGSTLKSNFWRDRIKILPLFKQHCHGRHYIM